MRVLLISRAMVAAAYRSRLREIARHGIELTVVAPDRWENQKFEPAPVVGYELIVARIALGWPMLRNLAHHIFYFEGVSRIISREKWDLVHIDDEPYNFATFHAAMACERNGVKFIFSTWQNQPKRYPPPFSLFERNSFAKAAGALPGNREALEILRERGFVGHAAVNPHHGIDVDLFRKQDASQLRRKLGFQNQFLVGYVGRIVPEKGVHILVRAMAKLPPECVLLIIGVGPSRPLLETIANDLGLRERVRWISWIATADLPEYLNAMDALVLPSITTKRWKEQLGRVLIEAMACETCVVGSDSGEIPEVIGDAGLVFQEGSERELTNCLRRLIEDASFCEYLGTRGRERVLEQFSDRIIAREAAVFYRAVCQPEALEFTGKTSSRPRRPPLVRECE